MALSRERIADELLKLLAIPDPTSTIAIMLERRIFKPVLPEVGTEGLAILKSLIEAEESARIGPDGLRRLAALLPRDPAVAESVAARLKLSNKARKRLACAATLETGSTPEALAYRLGNGCAVDRLLLAGKPTEAAHIKKWHSPHLPIGGGVLINRGLPEGPVIARTLRAIEDRWIEAGFPQGEAFDAIVADALAAAR